MKAAGRSNATPKPANDQLGAADGCARALVPSARPALTTTAEDDIERIEKLREAIRLGTFKVDHEKLAAKMLQEEL